MIFPDGSLLIFHSFVLTNSGDFGDAKTVVLFIRNRISKVIVLNENNFTKFLVNNKFINS
jgi:hypothetical protein